MERRTRWLVIVPDGAEVLTREIGQDGDEAVTVRTRQRLLVDLARTAKLMGGSSTCISC